MLNAIFFACAIIVICLILGNVPVILALGCMMLMIVLIAAHVFSMTESHKKNEVFLKKLIKVTNDYKASLVKKGYDKFFERHKEEFSRHPL
jgi:ABC-type transport system involved in cytochrome bd biosynthesis fused ATPase/permease subunit